MEKAREMFLNIANRYWGTPYIFGGNSAYGIDCSGLVIECLKSIGFMLLKEDDTSDGLWQRYFAKHGESELPDRGMLAFWFDDTGKAYHVAICLDDFYCLTADNGSSKVTSPDIAQAVNAYVKIRPIQHRRSKPKFIDIFKKVE